jgi:hypothetical protein
MMSSTPTRRTQDPSRLYVYRSLWRVANATFRRLPPNKPKTQTVQVAFHSTSELPSPDTTNVNKAKEKNLLLRVGGSVNNLFITTRWLKQQK